MNTFGDRPPKWPETITQRGASALLGEEGSGWPLEAGEVDRLQGLLPHGKTNHGGTRLGDYRRSGQDRQGRTAVRASAALGLGHVGGFEPCRGSGEFRIVNGTRGGGCAVLARVPVRGMVVGVSRKLHDDWPMMVRAAIKHRRSRETLSGKRHDQQPCEYSPEHH